ncbi:YbjQ family protein [Alkalihalobacillus trypoxylicola]|uniref:UPF0145 protein AZF04_09335 n=1 Tax=Alkalihalobacillus trypoxylicola TaxID=519424 RepID=A0A161P7P4_9BACI|nr:YbjQ family protein [Alkalihalobacillus trypoxylicola]KYG28098.1 hypothetical protein AZF04_09335 [Alkalihalobacillus trypoxylicola]
MIIVTTNEVNSYEVKKVLGLVKGSTVQTKHIGRDFAAGLKSVVGGEIRGYSEMMEEAREIAIKRMKAEAEKLGANAIIGFRLQSSMVMQSASEIIAYGTAVVIETE